MNNRYIHSILSSALSVIPMIAIVLILSFIHVDGVQLVPLGLFDYLALILGTFIMVVGLGLFQVGSSTGLAKVGEYMGSSLSQQEKLFVVIIFSFLLGMLITCAEPSLLVLANQVAMPSLLLIGFIAGGVGIFVVIGVIRIIFHGSLKLWYLIYYFLLFMLICLIAIDEESRRFLPFIFDAGGITTGSATVPFILALGAGIAAVRGGRKATNDSFGLVGMASIGPILSMAILILINRGNFSPYEITVFNGFTDFGTVMYNIGISLIPTSGTHLGTIIEVLMALIPIILIFVIYDRLFIKLPKNKIKELLMGFFLSFIGLVIFLTGVNAIMSPFGTLVGESVGKNIPFEWILIGLSFIIGLVTVLCEPAVHVLTTTINEVSDGAVKKSTVVISLSLGVGVAIGLSAIRTIYNFDIMYILIPGYSLSIILMFICPDIYTAMAFDAGGTASGPMSVSFVLPMIIGITHARTDYGPSSTLYYTRSFGVVALIALTPILTIQFLGVFHKFKTMYRLHLTSIAMDEPGDAQIIHFR